MARKTVVLIGAGSAVFTRGLVADLILDGQPWDLRLVDTSEENLDVAHGLARRMIDSRKADIKLSRATERKEVLSGADVVVTTIAVGGRRAWEKDVFIPRKYGINQPVGDTIMPGGISRGLRMIPQLVEIAGDVGVMAPCAHFFNYSNPMAANCRAVRKATGVPIVGLCHGVPGSAKRLAELAGVPYESLSYTAVGINHLTWFLTLKSRGEDAFPILRKRLAEYARMDAPPAIYADHLFSFEMFDVFGAFPAVFDRHICEFFPEFFRGGEHYGKRLGFDRFSFEGTIAGGDKGFAAMADQAAGRAPLDERVFQRAEGEHEQLLSIINALEGKGSGVFSVNVPNVGQVTNISRDFVLEGPAMISEEKIQPLAVGALPTGVAATVEKALRVVEMTVEAALERDMAKFVQALILDGSVHGVSEAHKLAAELVAAHKEHLPGW